MIHFRPEAVDQVKSWLLERIEPLLDAFVALLVVALLVRAWKTLGGKILAPRLLAWAAWLDPSRADECRAAALAAQDDPETRKRESEFKRALSLFIPALPIGAAGRLAEIPRLGLAFMALVVSFLIGAGGRFARLASSERAFGASVVSIVLFVRRRRALGLALLGIALGSAALINAAWHVARLTYVGIAIGAAFTGFVIVVGLRLAQSVRRFPRTKAVVSVDAFRLRPRLIIEDDPRGLGMRALPDQLQLSRKIQMTTCFAGFAGFGAFWGVWSTTLPDLQARAQVGPGRLGLGLLTIMLGGVVTMIPIGQAMDRFGRRAFRITVPILGGLGLVAANFLGSSTSPLVMVGILVLLGVAAGAVDVLINADASAYEAAFQRPFLHKGHAVFSAGLVVASGLTSAARLVGWQPLRTFGILLLLLLFIGAVQLAATPLRGGEIEPSPVWRSSIEDRRRYGFRLGPRIIGLCVVCGVAFMIEGSMQNWAAIHLETTLDTRRGLGGMAPMVFALAVFSSRIIGHRLVWKVRGRTIIVIGLAISGVGALLAGMGPNVPSVLLGVAVAGLGVGVCVPTSISLAVAQVPNVRRAAVVSLVTTIAYAGFVVSPALVGIVAVVVGLRWGLSSVGLVSLLVAGAGFIGMDGPRRLFGIGRYRDSSDYGRRIAA